LDIYDDANMFVLSRLLMLLIILQTRLIKIEILYGAGLLQNLKVVPIAVLGSQVLVMSYFYRLSRIQKWVQTKSNELSKSKFQGHQR